MVGMRQLKTRLPMLCSTMLECSRPVQRHVAACPCSQEMCRAAASQWARDRGVELRILSDCNSVFISHMLSGARASTLPAQIVTNPAQFVRLKGSQVPPPPLPPPQPAHPPRCPPHKCRCLACPR